jgi:hypothetical protein
MIELQFRHSSRLSFDDELALQRHLSREYPNNIQHLSVKERQVRVFKNIEDFLTWKSNRRRSTFFARFPVTKP